MLCCMLMSVALPLTLDSQCTIHLDCRPSMACIGGQCSDPCGKEGVCGVNATCHVVGRAASCTCPQCHNGDPKVECQEDVSCVRSEPELPPPIYCSTQDDCSDNEICDGTSDVCVNPCEEPEACEANKRCEVRRHRKRCICKFGFKLNSAGEFVCAGDNIECHRPQDCSSDLTCINNKCKSPCEQGNLCPPGKTCVTMNHQAVCLCLDDCSPSIEICLKDEGCPANLACVSYQCVDPCNGHVCAGDSPCYVEEHKPLCKFCPSGFTIDPVYGCVKGNHINKTKLLINKNVRTYYLHF